MNTSSPPARVLTTAIETAHTLPTTTLITSVPTGNGIGTDAFRPPLMWMEGRSNGSGAGSRTGEPRAVVGGPDRRLGTDARWPEPPDLPRRGGWRAVRPAGARSGGVPGRPRHPAGSGDSQHGTGVQ